VIPAREGHSIWLCSIHQGHLIVTHQISLLGISLTNALYSSCLLLRTGGHFLRLVLAVRVLVREQCTLLERPADEEDFRLCREFLLNTHSAAKTSETDDIPNLEDDVDLGHLWVLFYSFTTYQMVFHYRFVIWGLRILNFK